MTNPFGPDGTTWQDLKDWSVGSLIAANLVPLFGTLMSIFIVLKIVTDVIAHLKEHDMFYEGDEIGDEA